MSDSDEIDSFTATVSTLRPVRVWRYLAAMTALSACSSTTVRAAAPRRPAQALPARAAERHSAPPWRCEVEPAVTSGASAALSVESASIFADAVVGASLLVRERPGFSAADRRDIELRWQSEGGATLHRLALDGEPMIGAPWRIEDRRAQAVRRCDRQGRCALFALEPHVQLEGSITEDAAVFALRVEGAAPMTVIAAVDQHRVRGAASDGARFERPIVGGRTFAGLWARAEGVALIFRDSQGDRLLDEHGAPAPLEATRACGAFASEPFALVTVPVSLGAFGPAIELRAELAQDAASATCVRRLYGRGVMRLVESSVEVALRGPGPSVGWIRTPRGLSALRCVSNS